MGQALRATCLAVASMAIVAVSLAACGGEAETTPTPTPTATATPTQTPTQTPTPAASSSELQGKLIGTESQEPIAGAAIILCLVTAEKTCSLKANLVTEVKEDGSFELTNVPPASYVVLYDPSGKAMPGWKDIDGLEMILNLEGLSGFPSSARTELFSTFGGGGGITMQEGTSLEFEDGVVVGGDGSIISEKYGLTVDFREGKPIIIQVQPGRTTEVEIRAWAL